MLYSRFLLATTLLSFFTLSFHPFNCAIFYTILFPFSTLDGSTFYPLRHSFHQPPTTSLSQYLLYYIHSLLIVIVYAFQIPGYHDIPLPALLHSLTRNFESFPSRSHPASTRIFLSLVLSRPFNRLPSHYLPSPSVSVPLCFATNTLSQTVARRPRPPPPRAPHLRRIRGERQAGPSLLPSRSRAP